MKIKQVKPADCFLSDDEILKAIGGCGTDPEDRVDMNMRDLVADCRMVATATIAKIRGTKPTGWFDSEYLDYSRVNRIGWTPLYDLTNIAAVEDNEMVALKTENDVLKSELAQSQANDLCGMSYLNEIRQAMGHDGDFPSLVEAIRKMKKA